MMSKTAARRTLTKEVADFLASGPSADEIANYHISAEAQERVSALMERNESGTLTPDEVAELDEITVLDQLFTLVRARLVSPAPDHTHDGFLSGKCSSCGCEFV